MARSATASAGCPAPSLTTTEARSGSLARHATEIARARTRRMPATFRSTSHSSSTDWHTPITSINASATDARLAAGRPAWATTADGGELAPGELLQRQSNHRGQSARLDPREPGEHGLRLARTPVGQQRGGQHQAEPESPERLVRAPGRLEPLGDLFAGGREIAQRGEQLRPDPAGGRQVCGTTRHQGVGPRLRQSHARQQPDRPLRSSRAPPGRSAPRSDRWRPPPSRRRTARRAREARRPPARPHGRSGRARATPLQGASSSPGRPPMTGGPVTPHRHSIASSWRSCQIRQRARPCAANRRVRSSPTVSAATPDARSADSASRKRPLSVCASPMNTPAVTVRETRRASSKCWWARANARKASSGCPRTRRRRPSASSASPAPASSCRRAHRPASSRRPRSALACRPPAAALEDRVRSLVPVERRRRGRRRPRGNHRVRGIRRRLLAAPWPAGLPPTGWRRRGPGARSSVRSTCGRSLSRPSDRNSMLPCDSSPSSVTHSTRTWRPAMEARHPSDTRGRRAEEHPRGDGNVAAQPGRARDDRDDGAPGNRRRDRQAHRARTTAHTGVEHLRQAVDQVALLAGPRRAGPGISAPSAMLLVGCDGFPHRCSPAAPPGGTAGGGPLQASKYPARPAAPKSSRPAVFGAGDSSSSARPHQPGVAGLVPRECHASDPRRLAGRQIEDRT